MKANLEQIVDFSKVAKTEKQWTIEKIKEVAANNPDMEIGEVLKEVEAIKEVSFDDIVNLAEKEDLKPSTNDIEKTLLIIIDAQNDFHEGGALAVNGAREDTKRTIEFIYNWAHKITSIMLSLDTHTAAQIFHPIFWLDKNNNHPDPYTIITKDDITSGKYKPAFNITKAVDYVEGLGKKDKKDLCIWPYHCPQGTRGWLPEQQLVNMVYYHSVARSSRPIFYMKGQDVDSEMYGIFEKEYAKDGITMDNSGLAMVSMIEKYDKIYFLGQAKSHCVLESMKQFLNRYKNRPEITSKVVFVIDCSSCVAGFEDQTEKELQELVNTYGIKVMKSTEIQM